MRNHAVAPWTVILVAPLVIASAGCVGLLANLIHVGTGNKVPARFSGLADKRVAVVCVSNSASFGPTAASMELGRQIAGLIGKNVRKVQIIEPQKVADWIDQHDWDRIDFQSLGQGVGAQRVVAVDLDSFGLHDGPTLFKGRADVQITVHDIEQGGAVVYEATPPQIQFPVQAGYYTTELSEREFRRKFLAVLAERIARHFYAYELMEDFAQDTALLGL